ncbi:MAG: SRPBCC family protein [bacterium]
MVSTVTNRIEKEVILKAPLERVWQAVSDSAQFGAWFKARFPEPFAPGRDVQAEFTEPGFVGRTFMVRVEQMEKPRRFSFRWQPHEFGAAIDTSNSTLVEFQLDEHPDGTRLRVVETGFENVPADQRQAMLRGNDEGWAEQLGRVANYVSGTDRIEKQVTLNAPMERVWGAIANAEEFGKWFGLHTEGTTFEPGKTVSVKMSNPGEFDGMEFMMEVVSMEAGRLFSFRWHPFALDKQVDYSHEPMTLVEFFLDPVGAGTLLTLTESGFNAVPESRRALAFEMNEGGWAEQLRRIKAHLGA